MGEIARRQGLWLLAGGAVATALGVRAMAKPVSPVPTGGTLALVEKGAGWVAFYALPGGARSGTVAFGHPAA